MPEEQINAVAMMRSLECGGSNASPIRAAIGAMSTLAMLCDTNVATMRASTEKIARMGQTPMP